MSEKFPQECPDCKAPFTSTGKMRFPKEGDIKRDTHNYECGSCYVDMDGTLQFWRVHRCEIAALTAQLAAESKRAEDLQGHYDRDTAKLQQEIQRLSAANSGVYWRWQGDGGDYLESLTCPILIDVGQLKAMFDKIAAAEARVKGLEAACVEGRAAAYWMSAFTSDPVSIERWKSVFLQINDALPDAQRIPLIASDTLPAGEEAKDASVS